MTTVCNTGSGPDWLATTGANYRMIADLSRDGLLAVDSQGQSGNPGTGHYGDGLGPWSAGEYHELPLDPDKVSRAAVERLTLVPRT